MKSKLSEIQKTHSKIIREIILEWTPILLILANAIYLFYQAWELSIFTQIKRGDIETNNAIRTFEALYLIYILAGVFITALAAWMAIQISKNKKNKQLISRLNWTIERLAKLENTAKKTEQSLHNSESHWPWGSHHTNALSDLEAAAQRFWTLYDPNDPSTAPTNEMVATWLRDERGTSKDKATAIASILRADGLRPGPRH